MTTRNILPRFLQPLMAYAIVVASGAVCATQATAGNMDVGLQRNATKIVKFLRDHDPAVKNVGVLKFVVKMPGKSKASFHVGRLNYSMATRLENALILADRPKKGQAPIGVTRGAGEVAANLDRTATFLTVDGRSKLIQHTYPLAWGKRSVKVDGFLYGSVLIDNGYRSAKVLVFFFHKEDKQQKQVTQFQVKTDRVLLSDLNMKFYLAKRYWEDKKSGVIDWEEKVTDTAQPPGKKPPVVDPKTKMSDPENYLQFKLYYDGVLQQRGDDLTYSTPKGNQQILIKMKSTEKIGLVLLVNGVNTLYKEKWDSRNDAKSFSKWILEPNTEYTIRGFYIDNKKVAKFRALTEKEAAGSSLGPQEKLGLIELYVFRPGAQPDVEPKVDLHLRSVKRGLLSRRALQQHLLQVATGSGKTKGGLTKRTPIGEGELEDANLQTDTLRYPILVGRVGYRYYIPPGQ